MLGIALYRIVGVLVDLLPTPQAWIEANQQAVSNVSKGSMAAVFIALYVAAPISEELVFRGKGYAAIKRSCGSAVAIILTSLLFAVAHGNILQGIYAFVAGVVLSIIAEKTGSLITAVFAHAGFNISAALLYIYFGGRICGIYRFPYRIIGCGELCDFRG